jgi:predicted helicase
MMLSPGVTNLNCSSECYSQMAIDLLARVTTVSVETVKVVEALKAASR